MLLEVQHEPCNEWYFVQLCRGFNITGRASSPRGHLNDCEYTCIHVYISGALPWHAVLSRPQGKLMEQGGRAEMVSFPDFLPGSLGTRL